MPVLRDPIGEIKEYGTRSTDTEHGHESRLFFSIDRMGEISVNKTRPDKKNVNLVSTHKFL